MITSQEIIVAERLARLRREATEPTQASDTPAPLPVVDQTPARVRASYTPQSYTARCLAEQ